MNGAFKAAKNLLEWVKKRRNCGGVVRVGKKKKRLWRGLQTSILVFFLLLFSF